MDNATPWVPVCPIQRNEFATDFYPVAPTRSADVPSVLCYRRLQRNGILVAVALSRPTAIIVWGIPAVSVTFKRRWVLLLSLMCAEDDCFRYTCTVSVLVSKHFFRYRYRTDAGGIGRYRVPDASIGLTLVCGQKSADKCRPCDIEMLADSCRPTNVGRQMSAVCHRL